MMSTPTQEFETPEQMAEASRLTTGPKKKDKHPEKLIECEVPVDLTDVELAEIADQLADKTLEELDLVQTMKDAAAEGRKKRKEIKTEIKRLAQERKAKSAITKMQCVEVQEFPTRIAIYRLDLERTDPRALVSERPFTKDELHVPMFDADKLGEANKAAAGNDGAPAGDGGGEAAPGGRKRTKKPKGGATQH